MKSIFYNKLFSGLSISLSISFLLSKFIFKSSMLFIFSLSFFGALYLFLSWLMYLKLDGVVFFQNKFKKASKRNLDFRFQYKKKGVYNIDKDFDCIETNEIPEDKILKATIYGYLSSGIILLICSSLFYHNLA